MLTTPSRRQLYHAAVGTCIASIPDAGATSPEVLRHLRMVNNREADRLPDRCCADVLLQLSSRTRTRPVALSQDIPERPLILSCLRTTWTDLNQHRPYLQTEVYMAEKVTETAPREDTRLARRESLTPL